jgi:hypothetical protein
MNMIRHYNVFIQFNATEMIRNRPPTSLYDVAQIVQQHALIIDSSEQGLPTMATNCDKVRSLIAIVVPLDTNGTPMMDGRIESHGSRPGPGAQYDTGSGSPDVLFYHEGVCGIQPVVRL